ncbi:MAG: EipB family protein [Kiloniellaceae bacterium]
MQRLRRRSAGFGHVIGLAFGLWGLLPLLTGIASAPWAPARAGPGFTPPRAVYDLSLGKSRSNRSISQAHGKLEFEWTDVCTGWTVSQRTRVQMTTGEGRVVEFGWTLNALEAKDGQRYRFFIRRFDADGGTVELRGEARLEGPGEGGVAIYTEPEAREIALPKGTLFPTGHSLLLIEAAEKNQMPLWRLVFDGSGEEGLFGINAALAQVLPSGSEVRFASPLLRGQKSWRMQLAFFGMDETAAAPEHEQALRLFANGVVDEMTLDYGDFSLNADLELLEPLPPPEC